MKSAVVFGGYGTFGILVTRELARLGIPVVVAGRDARKAEEAARALGLGHWPARVDVTRLDSCRAALQGHAVAVNCAGPFARFDTALLEACLLEGCHYVDIADERRYTALVRGLDARFLQKGLAAVYGCSSLPAISGALALAARAGSTAVPERARVTLFIGNDNPKGRAAVETVVAQLGQPLAAPQGILHGFRDREVVTLPEPFGRRAVFNVESPEYDLFPTLLGVRSVSVKVGFELRSSTYFFAVLAFLGLKYGRRTSRLLDWLGRWAPRSGTSGGAVMTELFYAGGLTRRVALAGRRDGQRMAALPCAFAAQALAEDPGRAQGALTAYDLLGGAGLLDRLVAEGFTLWRDRLRNC